MKIPSYMKVIFLHLTYFFVKVCNAHLANKHVKSMTDELLHLDASVHRLEVKLSSLYKSADECKDIDMPTFAAVQNMYGSMTTFLGMMPVYTSLQCLLDNATKNVIVDNAYELITHTSIYNNTLTNVLHRIYKIYYLDERLSEVFGIHNAAERIVEQQKFFIGEVNEFIVWLISSISGLKDDVDCLVVQNPFIFEVTFEEELLSALRSKSEAISRSHMRIAYNQSKFTSEHVHETMNALTLVPLPPKVLKYKYELIEQIRKFSVKFPNDKFMMAVERNQLLICDHFIFVKAEDSSIYRQIIQAVKASAKQSTGILVVGVYRDIRILAMYTKQHKFYYDTWTAYKLE